MSVGIKISEYLKENGITQVSVSKKTAIPAPKLNLSLRGKRKLTFEEYQLICGALGLGTEFFISPKSLEGEEVG